MRRTMGGLVLALIIILVLACSAPAQVKPETGAAPAPAPRPAPVPAPAPAIGPPVVIPAPAPRPAPVPAPSISIQADADRLIVRTANIAILVDDVPGNIDKISKIAEDFKGSVVSSNSRREGERLIGSISIRVPVDRYSDAVRAIRGLALEVTSEASSAKDVTEEYTDLGASLRNLEATEQQLIRLMERATRIEDVLAIQRELTSVRGQIERTKGRMLFLERTSATSIINVSLNQALVAATFSVDKGQPNTGEPVRFIAKVTGGIAPFSYQWDFGDGQTANIASPSHVYNSGGTYTVTLRVTDDRRNSATTTRSNYVSVASGWSPGNTARNAWNGLTAFGKIFMDVLIWLLAFSPVWIVALAIWYWRRRMKRGGKGA